MGQYAYVVYKRLELEKCLPEILKERLPSISNFKEEMTRPWELLVLSFSVSNRMIAFEVLV